MTGLLGETNSESREYGLVPRRVHRIPVTYITRITLKGLGSLYPVPWMMHMLTYGVTNGTKNALVNFTEEGLWGIVLDESKSAASPP